MGNSKSSSYHKRISRLLPEELDRIDVAFDKMSGTSPGKDPPGMGPHGKDPPKVVSLQMFKAYIKDVLPESMIVRLYDAIRIARISGKSLVRSEQFSKEQLTVFICDVFKGSVEEKGGAILQIVSPKDIGPVKGLQIQEFTEDLIIALGQVLHFKKLLHGWSLGSRQDYANRGKIVTGRLMSKLKHAGDTGCFLFSLSPNLEVYNCTGYNEHYMYLNYGTQTMPNGLGMGGQHEYFGLWIDSNFGQGHSRGTPTCTTYNSPPLSSTENFSIDVLEAWAVGDRPEGLQDRGKTSILDVDPEARVLLEMSGKAQHSDGLREPKGSDEEDN